MQGTNVLFGQIAVVFGIVIAGVWSATQALVRFPRYAGLLPLASL